MLWVRVCVGVCWVRVRTKQVPGTSYQTVYPLRKSLHPWDSESPSPEGREAVKLGISGLVSFASKHCDTHRNITV